MLCTQDGTGTCTNNVAAHWRKSSPRIYSGDFPLGHFPSNIRCSGWGEAVVLYRQWLHTQALGNTQADPEQLTERWQKHVHWCREWHEEMHAGKRERLDFSSFIKIVFWKTKTPRLLPRLLYTGSLGVSFLETQPLGEDSSSASAFHLKVAQG